MLGDRRSQRELSRMENGFLKNVGMKMGMRLNVGINLTCLIWERYYLKKLRRLKISLFPG
jgi:hypothetical protein